MVAKLPDGFMQNSSHLSLCLAKAGSSVGVWSRLNHKQLGDPALGVQDPAGQKLSEPENLMLMRSLSAEIDTDHRYRH